VPVIIHATFSNKQIHFWESIRKCGVRVTYAGDGQYAIAMTRLRKPSVTATRADLSGAATDDIMRIKAWLLGVSTMVWWRVLVPANVLPLRWCAPYSSAIAR
jgi:hypothetical protein